MIIVLTLGDQITEQGVASIPFQTWMDDISEAVNSLEPLSGTGTPEGNFIASPNRLYIDTSAQVIYFKETGDGNTGWLQVS